MYLIIGYMQGMCRSMMIIKMMIHEPSPIFDKQKNIILYQKTVERHAKSFILIEFGDDLICYIWLGEATLTVC